jgi:hypothetical protein
MNKVMGSEVDQVLFLDVTAFLSFALDAIAEGDEVVDNHHCFNYDAGL